MPPALDEACLPPALDEACLPPALGDGCFACPPDGGCFAAAITEGSFAGAFAGACLAAASHDGVCALAGSFAAAFHDGVGAFAGSCFDFEPHVELAAEPHVETGAIAGTASGAFAPEPHVGDVTFTPVAGVDRRDFFVTAGVNVAGMAAIARGLANGITSRALVSGAAIGARDPVGAGAFAPRA